MDEQNGLTFDSVRNYLFQNGGKVKNYELVKHFKPYLTHPDLEKQAQAKLCFRDYINELATLKEENGVKYLVLRKKYSKSTCTVVNKSSPANAENKFHQNGVWPQGKFHTINETPVGYMVCKVDPISPILPQDDVVRSVPTNVNCKSSYFAEINQEVKIRDYQEVPLPPPRRRGERRESSGKIEETLRQLNKENSDIKIPKSESVTEPIVSPGTVRERAQSLNKLASENELRIKSSSSSSLSSQFIKGNLKSNIDDDDTSSLTSLNPYRREWTIKAAQGDYLSLVRMLKEEPRLANFKDFISGFTALHWAAKHGSCDIVKLMAGKHKVNPNIRSHGGYTPLHVAAMFNRMEIIELLKAAYGADETIRDYSGKRPEDYLPKTAVTKERKTSTTNSSVLISRTFPSIRSSLHQSFLRSTRPIVRSRSIKSVYSG